MRPWHACERQNGTLTSLSPPTFARKSTGLVPSFVKSRTLWKLAGSSVLDATIRCGGTHAVTLHLAGSYLPCEMQLSSLDFTKTAPLQNSITRIWRRKSTHRVRTARSRATRQVMHSFHPLTSQR